MNTILLAIISTIVVSINVLVAFYAASGILRYIQLRFTDDNA